MPTAEKGKSERSLPKLFAFLILSLILLALLVLALIRQENEPWKTYQKAYRAAQAQKQASALQGTLPEGESRSTVESAAQAPLRVKELKNGPASTGSLISECPVGGAGLRS